MTRTKEIFIQLIRLGTGHSESIEATNDEGWEEVKILAEQQGLSAIMLDGIERLKSSKVQDVQGPPQEFLFEWIGETLQDESLYSLQGEVAKDVAKLFYRNGIKMYVLKGTVVSECYPKPQHRVSVDIDCFLLPLKGDFDAWSLGNDLIRNKGFHVNTDFYKNSSFDISGVSIENHQYLTPFRGNKRLIALEKKLQELIRQDRGEDIIEGTCMYRPPVMVTALFLIEHAYSHFLHEGLTWRHVLDWMMFSRKHEKEIDWKQLEAWIDEFGFRSFYNTYFLLGQLLFGEIEVSRLTKQDHMMLRDIWADLDVHETVRGFKGKLALAGNTWRARWKYRYFSEDSMLKALWIQAKGVLFEKNPSLNI